MLLLLLLYLAAHTPAQATPLKLTKSSIVRNKLIDILNNASLHQDNLSPTYVKGNLRKKDETSKLRLIDLDSFEKKMKYEQIKLAFNKEATKLLKKLLNELETLNQNLSTKTKKLKTKTKQIYVVKVNEDKSYARHKRDTNDVEDVEVKRNTSVDPEVVTAKPTVEDKTTTEAKTVANETVTNINKTELTTEEIICNKTINGRRRFNADDTEVSRAIKTRLLSYITEYFNDIATKTNSLRDIKNTFATNDEYNIGYIIANIDGLGINLHNLRLDIEMNHEGWNEKQILDMFDKIKMSHSVVSSLLEALKTIMDKPPVKADKRSQYLHLV